MMFVVDQNLPVWLASWLRDQGHGAVHLREVGMQAADDSMVATLVRERRGVLITKDGDFAQPPGPGAPVVWVRIGNATHSRLANTWARMWPEIEAGLAAGDQLIEVRG
ncbi:MAG: DUF5615 family PIN-like protein [Oceanicaulis sp.]